MNSEYDPDKKIYKAGEHTYSINELLFSAVDDEYMSPQGMPRISDFHLKVGGPVRFRLDEDLRKVPDGEPLTPELIEQMLFGLLREDDLKKLKSSPNREIDAGYELVRDEGKYNFRLNLFRDRDGLAAVIRLLPPNVPSLEQVGFPYDSIWEDIVHIKQGLVLVTGITGSGKSTTIASLINYINQHRPVRIITLEDPIEYVFYSDKALISQRAVGTHTESFARGLFAALRENPDVIYVGEVRDQDTASLALSAAETGHLVFSTLHTRDAVGAVTRMVDMFPAERTKELSTQLSFSLSYVISQKLIPRADGTGRCVAMEVMTNSSGIPNLLRTGKLHQIYSVMETRADDGMITMEQDLVRLCQEGVITREEAILHANRDDIINRLPDE